MGAPFFIDKMPNNFRHIGLDQAHAAQCQRLLMRAGTPCPAAFSGFKQLFAEGQMFSYDLEDIAQYYSGLCAADGPLG